MENKKKKGTKKAFRHKLFLRHCEFDFSVKIYWSVFPFCWNTMYALKYVSAWLRAGFVKSAESFISERCAIIWNICLRERFLSSATCLPKWLNTEPFREACLTHSLQLNNTLPVQTIRFCQISETPNHLADCTRSH